MKINSIEIKNFRNIKELNLEPSDKTNIIYGDNAQGKTNLIEAIWLFSGLKSFRGSHDKELIKFGYSMIFVASMYRPLTATPEQAVEGLREIEAWSGLRAEAIINNSNLGRETSTDDIAASLPYINKISELTSLPCLAVTLHSESAAEALSVEYPEYNFLVIPDSTKKLF